MSYCRINDDSDVYCWSNGKNTEEEWFHVSINRADPSDLAFIVTGLEHLEWLLRKLNADGYRVPQETFDRIRAELLLEHPNGPA